MQNIQWGIIGAGDVTEHKSGPAFSKIEHSSLIAVMRRNEEKVKDYAQRHNIPKYYTDVDLLINDPDVNAIYIATPPSSHKEYTIKSLMAGKPVYVEKPMAMNYAECQEMIEAAHQANQKLFVAYYRRALPYFQKVRSLLEKNVIGDLLTVEIKHYRSPRLSDLDPNNNDWHIDPNIGGEGYFYDLAPHTLDILDFLLGEINDAKGYSSNRGGLYKVSDTISAVLRFQSGITGSGQWCFVSSKEEEIDRIEIYGKKGKISFSTFAFTPIKVAIEGKKAEFFDLPKPEHIQQPLIQTIVNEIREVGKCPSTGVSGARTSRIMDLILRK